MSYYTGLKRLDKMTRKYHNKKKAKIRRARIALEVLLSEI